MSEEPTPSDRARFIVARISAAMQDFAEMHPCRPAGERVEAHYRALGGRDWEIVRAHYEPLSAVDWSLDFKEQREAAQALAAEIEAYVGGAADLPRVKAVYQRFAAAHLVWWMDGRMFYAEEAARLHVAETCELARDTATATHPARVAGAAVAYSGFVARLRRGWTLEEILAKGKA